MIAIDCSTTRGLNRLTERPGQNEQSADGGGTPRVRRNGQAVEPIGINAAGLAAGVDGAANFQAVTVSLGPGDLVTLFTDGLTEAMRTGTEPFGLERLKRFVAEQTGDARQIV
ncbi:MAG TPA: SpoIIE family protein phosphatase [Planctomycetaceae bacterium]|nr:SpoIIE family protein phosphatase [Planctomycetaceae bacterium]